MAAAPSQFKSMLVSLPFLKVWGIKPDAKPPVLECNECQHPRNEKGRKASTHLWLYLKPEKNVRAKNNASSTIIPALKLQKKSSTFDHSENIRREKVYFVLSQYPSLLQVTAQCFKYPPSHLPTVLARLQHLDPSHRGGFTLHTDQLMLLFGTLPFPSSSELWSEAGKQTCWKRGFGHPCRIIIFCKGHDNI